MADKETSRHVANGTGRVAVHDGVIVVDGPGPTALTLTPDAARRLSETLASAARKASADDHSVN